MFRLFLSGILWHYTKAYKEIFILWKRSLWFVFHLFSISDLTRTLFLPWQQLGERYQGGFHLGKWLESLAVNMLMRLVGIIVRSFVIVIGLCITLIVCIAFVAVYILWTCVPFILVFLFITSLRLLLSAQ